MDALMAFVGFASIVAAVVGVVLCIFRSRRQIGKQIAFGGVVGFVFAIGFTIAQGPKTEVEQRTATVTVTQPANAAVEVAAAKPPSYGKVLSLLSVDSLTWNKKAFGMTMNASFVIRNNSSVDVKDIVVVCEHSANSGTKIDSNTKTVYEIVESYSHRAVIDVNMGFIHSAVTRSGCRVESYTPA